MNKIMKYPLSTLLSENTVKLKSMFSCNDGKSNLLQLLPTHISQKIPPLRKNQQASVLVILIDTGLQNSNALDRLSILFTKRSSHLKQHANEISFPGGHQEPDLDGGCLINTAIRETYEELVCPDENDFNTKYGDIRQSLEVFGQAETIPSATLVPVTPYYAYFRHEISNTEEFFPGNNNEVSQVFTISISKLLTSEKSMSLKRLGIEGPLYPTKYGNIWGLTALILKPYLHEVLKPVFQRNLL